MRLFYLLWDTQKKVIHIQWTAYIQAGMETLLEPTRAETQKEFFIEYSPFDLDPYTLALLVKKVNQHQLVPAGLNEHQLEC